MNKKNIKHIVPPKAWIGLVLAFLLSSCVEEFNPDIGNYESSMVILGSIIKEDSLQVVSISRSKSIYDNAQGIVTGGRVKVVDDKGNQFFYTEQGSGIYTCVIPETYLNYGSRFKLIVDTEDRNFYESGYESITEGTEVNKVYYEEKAYQSSSEYHDNGLQFFVDLIVPEGQGKNYMWRLEETWGYRSPYIPTDYYYILDGEFDGTFWIVRDYEIKSVDFNPDSIYFCYSFNDVKNIFSSTTQNLVIGEKKKIPLNYVASTSHKLNVKYSLLVKQFALSDSAFIYWNQNQVQINELGGLYESQPAQTFSNIYNINNPDEVVLGYFWASSYKEKRIFFEGHLDKHHGLFDCDLLEFRLDEIAASVHALQNIGTPNSPRYLTGPIVCFDCNKSNDTNQKPDFW